MAMANVKTQCSICNETEDTYECKGCSVTFCFDHVKDHREIINKEFKKIEDDYNLFGQILNEQKNNSLIKQINQWKEDSINKIQQIAKECEQKLINYTNKYFIEIENNLNKLTDEIKEFRRKNKFNEITLNVLKEQLNKLKKEFKKPSNVTIQQEPTSFINKIFVITPFDKDTQWKQVGITIAGGNGEGNQLNQLSNPESIFIHDDQTIYIADSGNDRIVEWKFNATNGRIVAGGNETNQLNRPRDVIINKENNSLIIADQEHRRVMRWSRQNNTNEQIIISDIDCSRLAMDKNGSLYVSDWENSEVKRWKRGEKDGTIVAGGNGKGNNRKQLNGPTFIFVDDDDSLYVSDNGNNRVMKWLKDAKEGIVVAGGNGKGNSVTQLFSPRGVTVDQFGQIYVADFQNDRVMRWCREAKEGTIVVGRNGKGQQSNQLNGPHDLSFDGQGNLFVVDRWNNRIQKFEIDFD